ncbi:NADH:ubiquinone reductase (Na(+)-transporting) subunit E [Candidatus Bipolaricaulota bacterium]|nr:NADH:ubiquinone reductase (Na(+)-transporting) subunit E [Candidatus Bipolaricaulota bacterium]
MRYISILIAAIFAHNIALRYFLGWCPLVSQSKKLSSAWGMGVAVTLVMTVTSAVNWPVYNYLLVPYGLEYLQYIAFIIVIASTVQVLEMVIERFFPSLYTTMGVFLPLITVNCAILGVSLFMILRDYTFLTGIIYALGSGIGWSVAIVSLGSIRERLRFSNVPKPLQGPGITMLIAGIMAFAFLGFSGMVGIK